MCRGMMKNINIIKSSYISKRTVENMRIARIRKKHASFIWQTRRPEE